MGTRARALGLAACVLLLAGCHGPPIMARIQPRPPSLRQARPAPARPRGSDLLKTPAFIAPEGRPGDVITDRMIDDIERAIRLRREAKRPPPDPCSQIIERARRLKYGPRVGQEERGSIPLPVCRLLEFAKKQLSK